LAQEFTAEVAAWGGPAVLRDLGTVAEVVAAVITPPPPPLPAPTATLTLEEVTTDPARRKELAGRLWDLDQVRQWATVKVALTWVGMVLLWMMAAPGAGAIVFQLVDRTLFGRDAAERVGVVVGFAAAAGIAWAMATARSSIRRNRDETITRFAADYPRLVESWGGPDVLRSPEAVAGLLAKLSRTVTPPTPQPDPPAEPPPVSRPSPTATLLAEEVTADPARKAALVGRLRELERLQRGAAVGTTVTWVLLGFLWFFGLNLSAGLTFGAMMTSGRASPVVAATVFIVAALFVLWGGWMAMAAMRRNLHRKLEEAVGRFAADYSRLVEAWGGPAVLRSPEALAGLLKTFEPTP
jgi:hypothetical protein